MTGSSVLLIGKNGTGKTSVGLALEILQRIGRGTNRVAELVKPKDLTQGRAGVPMRLELEVKLQDNTYGYGIAFDFPDGFKELRVLEEKLTVNGRIVYTRHLATVQLTKSGTDKEAIFNIDWHLVALPIIQQKSDNDAVSILKQWLAHMLILRPLPSLITGDSERETLQPDPPLREFGAWFSGVVAYAPSAYSQIAGYLKEVMPDFQDIKNPRVGANARTLLVQFSGNEGSMTLPFSDLSDGEKCFMAGALVLASNAAYGPVLCFWDEPDNYLAPSEVGHFVLALRRAFSKTGQFIATSHNPEAIRRFSDENTLLVYRNSHLEPTVIRRLEEIQIEGDLVGALVRGDLDQ